MYFDNLPNSTEIRHAVKAPKNEQYDKLVAECSPKRRLLRKIGLDNSELIQKTNFYIAELKKGDQQLKDLEGEKKSMLEKVLKEQERKMNELRLKHDFEMKMKVEYHVREMDEVKDQLKKVESEKQSKIEELEKALISSQEKACCLQTQFESCSKMIEERGVQLDGQIAKHATLFEQVCIIQKVFSEQENKIDGMKAQLDSYKSTIEEREQELQSDLISKVDELEQLKRDHSSVVCELKEVKTKNIKLKKHLKMFNKHVNVFSKLATALQSFPVSKNYPLLKSLSEPKPDELLKENLVDVVSEMDRLNAEQEHDEIRFVF
uniref:Uncharacterized protein n=1 Tax=Panagrolaimus sp. JU765 TaxID=591449 RepID=A0AC34R2J4_9BILA